MQHYVRDRDQIRQQTFDKIKEVTLLDSFTAEQKQIVLHLVKACGTPVIAEKIVFSEHALEAAKKAIKNYACILYDDEPVKMNLDKKLLYQEPLGFINKASVISHAKSNKQPCGMAAVELWRKHLNNAICLFGDSAAGLFRLMEMIREEDAKKPALIIATPAGFVNVVEAKQYLMDNHEELGVEYILIQGNLGGNILAATIMNTLLRIQKEDFV